MYAPESPMHSFLSRVYNPERVSRFSLLLFDETSYFIISLVAVALPTFFISFEL